MNTEITREDIIEYKKNFLNLNEELDKEKLNAEIYMPLMKMINDGSLHTYLIIGEKVASDIELKLNGIISFNKLLSVIWSLCSGGINHHALLVADTGFK